VGASRVVLDPNKLVVLDLGGGSCEANPPFYA
jgi:hypothetical protein